MASRNNRLMCRPISRKGIRYNFAWAACHLSIEMSERAPLKSVTKIQCPKLWNGKTNKKKKNCQPQGMKDYDTCLCIYESVGRLRQYTMGEGMQCHTAMFACNRFHKTFSVTDMLGQATISSLLIKNQINNAL